MNKPTLTLLLMLLTLPVIGLAQEKSPPVKDLNEIIRSLAPMDGTVNADHAIDLDIRFETDSAELSPGAHRQLDELGKALNSDALKENRIAIYGHTDAVGRADYNLELSERRARSVAAYLQEHFDIAEERLEIKGFGEERLKNPLAPSSGENRRVEIVNLGAAPSGEALDKEGRIQW